MTTADLRSLLFNTISDLRNGKIDHKDAAVVAKLSTEIVKTADLELRYNRLLQEQDAKEEGLTPGPILLTSDRNA